MNITFSLPTVSSSLAGSTTPIGILPKGVHSDKLLVLDTFTYVLGDFDDVHGVLKTQFPTSIVIDFSTGKVVNPVHPRTAPDQIFVQGTLTSDAVASIAYRKAPASADDRYTRWIISGTEGEIELTITKGHWQYGHEGVSRSLKIKVGKDGELQNLDLTNMDTSPASKIPNPGTNTARLYQSFAKGQGLEATFESATKTHRLLDRIAKSAGW
jgi:predicted dehydrogenase